MLHQFLTTHREELIRRCRQKDGARLDPPSNPAATGQGVPVFLQQLIETLRHEAESAARDFGRPIRTPLPLSINNAAALHGAELLHLGYSIDQVVHGYGDVCQAVTELALEQRAAIQTNEFRILNRCLDDAIAGAVTAFGLARQARQDGDARDQHFQLVAISEDQQRLIDTAMQAFSAVRTGSIGLSGATGTVLMHTLLELRDLAKQITEVTEAGAPPAGSPVK
jgi:hypothetical protein